MLGTNVQKTREELSANAVTVDTAAKSKNFVAVLTADVFAATIDAWKAVRDGKYDMDKYAVIIVASPQTYVGIAAVAGAIRERAGADTKEVTVNAVRAALMDAAEASATGATGSSHQSFGGIGIFPDARCEYIGVGVATRNPAMPAQVFDAEHLARLEESYAAYLKMEAEFAKSEMMDELATVSGQVGRA